MYRGDYDTSKYIVMLLRHHPEYLNLNMSEDGWVLVDELIEKVNKKKKYAKLNIEKIKTMVANNNKQRFDLKEIDGVYYIRANQGHSIKSLDMHYEPVTPLDVLYHGTATKSVDSILESGIQKRGRQYVHLSADIKTATKVGERHGDVVILSVDAKQMHEDGIEFYLSKNGVWLTDYVATKYIKKL